MRLIVMANSFSHIGNHAINVLARLAAKNAVKQQLRDQGVRVTLVPPRDITTKANEYLSQHPELYEEALQRARKLGLIKHVERIDQAVFDDERRRYALMPEWQRSERS
jgi:hypothetical protein